MLDSRKVLGGAHVTKLQSYLAGSVFALLLLANAAHLLSSHADAAIVRPGAIQEFAHPQWRFHFLQHGVIRTG